MCFSVWNAEAKLLSMLLFLSFPLPHEKCELFIIMVSAEFSNSRWAEIHGYSMHLASSLYSSLRTMAARVAPILEPKAIRNGDIFALLWKGRFSCSLQWSHKYLQASISESPVSDLTDNPKPQNVVYEALTKATWPEWDTTVSINKNGHRCQCWSLKFPQKHGTNSKE